jgi:hypothetical protein
MLKDGLKAHLEDGYPFKEAFRSLLWSYRATPHSLTGVSPAELMIGRRMATPLSTLRRETKDSHPLEKRVRERQQRRFEKLNANRSPPSQFSIGEYVRVKRPFAKGKLSSRLSGPYRIVQVVSPTVLKLENGSRWHIDNCVRATTGMQRNTELPILDCPRPAEMQLQPVTGNGGQKKPTSGATTSAQ